MDDLHNNGSLNFMVGDVAVALTKDDLLIDMAQKEGYVSEENNKMTVVLDTNLSEALIEEGFMYEVISKIQTMRKEAGFEVMDHIKVAVKGNDKIAAVVNKNSAAISAKVLAVEIVTEEELTVSKQWDINGEKATISIEKQ